MQQAYRLLFRLESVTKCITNSKRYFLQINNCLFDLKFTGENRAHTSGYQRVSKLYPGKYSKTLEFAYSNGKKRMIYLFATFKIVIN